MKKKFILLFILAVLVLVCFALFAKLFPQTSKSIQKNSKTSQEVEKSPKIIVDYPKPGDVVTSPLVVKGRARGTWYFEGEFPITLYYGVKDAFVDVNAFAIGEWMTEEYVDFEVIINFPVPPENDGLLVLRKNNPSDLEELEESLSIPLRFRK